MLFCFVPILMQGPRCSSIEEVLSKRLLCTHPQQAGEGDGGGRQQGGDRLNHGGSLHLTQGDSRKDKRESVPPSAVTSPDASTGLNSNATHLVTHGNKTSQSDLKGAAHISPQHMDVAVSEPARHHQSGNTPGSSNLPSSVVSGQQQEGHTSEVVVLQSGNRAGTLTTSAPSGGPSSKISPPKQEVTRKRILSPLVTHSHRLLAMPTSGSHNPKEEDSSSPKNAKQSDAREDRTEDLFSPTNSQLPITSFPSPFFYTAVPHPWTPSMEWQLPSMLSLMMAPSPSPSPHVQRQSEIKPPSNALPEGPKWMWADLFGGLASNSTSAGANALPSSIFSPQQLLSQPMSPFSPSKLLNLPMAKVDSLSVVASSAAYSSGCDSGGEGSSLEESPFKGMHKNDRKNEQVAMAGVTFTDACTEEELEAHAAIRPRPAKRSQDANMVCVCVCVCVCACMPMCLCVSKCVCV